MSDDHEHFFSKGDTFRYLSQQIAPLFKIYNPAANEDKCLKFENENTLLKN